MLALSSHDVHEVSNEFLGGPMLEDFNFNDLFLDFDDKDVLPDLEVDPAGEVDLADFSFDGEEEFRMADHETAAAGDLRSADDVKLEEVIELVQYKNEVVGSDNATVVVSTDKEGRKSSTAAKANAKGSNGKRKMKVDWTPELHRRFVQAVEQLGIDKAVPSRILEIMGIDCLTRHNVASHLQKYRRHRRHLLAREAEAANWSHRQHMAYATAIAAGGRNPNRERVSSSWVAPTTMAFPPPHPLPPPAMQMHHHFRPLHVWGHPTMDIWPKHFGPGPAPAPPPLWLPTPWLPYYPKRFTSPTVACVPPHPLYRPDSTTTTTAVPPNNEKQGSQLLLLDSLPSKDSIDAALGDVLAKPWLPLPLGLKPPSLDSVLAELQKQRISKVPPSS